MIVTDVAVGEGVEITGGIVPALYDCLQNWYDHDYRMREGMYCRWSKAYHTQM